jgi:hypothetical protein
VVVEFVEGRGKREERREKSEECRALKEERGRYCFKCTIGGDAVK